MLIDAGKLAIQIRIRYLFFIILRDLCRMKKVCSGGHQQPPDTNRNDSGDGQPCVFRGCCQYCCSHPLPVYWCTRPSVHLRGTSWRPLFMSIIVCHQQLSGHILHFLLSIS